jgi:hydroxyacylglutathione hydrolase
MAWKPQGYVLQLGSRRLQVLDTPGHARHHIAVHDPFSQSVFAGDTFGISYREFDRGERQFVFPTTSPVQFDPQAAHHSVDRILACQPQSVYVTHYSRLTDLVNIAASMHRLIDAHAELALAVQSTGAAREAELVAGVKRLFLAETARFGCTLGEEQALALMGLDIQLNGQGLASWLDSR